MKIAIFTDIYAPWGDGGIAASVKAQKDALLDLGHDVTVFCPGFNAQERGVVNVPTHPRLTVNNTAMAKRPAEIRRFVLKKFPDFKDFEVVHAHYEMACSMAGMQLAREFGIPLVQTMHGREDMAIEMNVPAPFKLPAAAGLKYAHAKFLSGRVGRLGRAFDRKLDEVADGYEYETRRIAKDRYQAPSLARAKMWELMVEHANFADIIITPSAHFAKKLEHYGVKRPIRVVSNGVDDGLVKREFEVRKWEEGQPLKMIWNSRVSQEKRILPFLQALTKFEKPYELVVYGDGNALNFAEIYAKQHKMNVKFMGRENRNKILAAMGKAQLAIMASYNFDTQGMTILEAKATGLPVFFCDPDMKEVVPEGGFVLSQGPEPIEMAMALNKIQYGEIEAMSRVMMRHRKDALQSTQIKTLLDVYEFVAQKP